MNAWSGLMTDYLLIGIIGEHNSISAVCCYCEINYITLMCYSFHNYPHTSFIDEHLPLKTFIMFLYDDSELKIDIGSIGKSAALFLIFERPPKNHPRSNLEISILEKVAPASEIIAINRMKI